MPRLSFSMNVKMYTFVIYVSNPAIIKFYLVNFYNHLYKIPDNHH